MTAGLAASAAAVDIVFILAALMVCALSVWALEAAQNAVRNWPFIGGQLAGLLNSIESGLVNFSDTIISRATALLRYSVDLMVLGVHNLIDAFTGPLHALVAGLQSQLGAVTAALALTVLPPVEREIPGWFKALEDEMRKLPNEPAFRSGGPLRLVLSWLASIWAVASRLGPFVRAVALPVLLVLGLLWGIVEFLGRLTRMQVQIDGLIGFAKNLDFFRQRDEATIAQLVVATRNLTTQNQLLQVDLEKERAARVLLATQTQQALNAAERLSEARRAADKSQWSPLLTLTLLATLSASLIQTLRKTAECDPCAQIDQNLSDLPWRVAALEAYGEQN